MTDLLLLRAKLLRYICFGLIYIFCEKASRAFSILMPILVAQLLVEKVLLSVCDNRLKGFQLLEFENSINTLVGYLFSRCKICQEHVWKAHTFEYCDIRGVLR